MERKFQKPFHRVVTMQPYRHDEEVVEMECFNFSIYNSCLNKFIHVSGEKWNDSKET